ncbi:MAG: asparagine synthase (glutamine-hydrolyzing) [Gammaproteobacteria bacterium]
MCGIAGWFGAGTAPAQAEPELRRMLDAIAHRGPDGSGVLCGEGFAFAHARLAIIDLGGGAQPMTSVDGTASIVFNGEIYNYAALRADLQAAGMHFATASDTEVVLNQYLAHGAAGFADLRGMFAFAIWDRRSRSGLLVRDRFGIKPLFYARRDDGGVAFASEAKGILALRPGGARLDPAALHLVMNFRYLPGERSMFAGISQLAPGEIIAWRAGATLESTPVGAYPGRPQGGTLAVFAESVRAHMVADVEVGTYLSGGIDSAAVTALARDAATRPLRTFTVAVGDDPAEADNAAETARLLGVANSRGDWRVDAAAQLPKLLWHLEVPKINAWQVSAVAAHAAREVKVALSGLGGDELFLGYPIHRLLDWARRLQSAAPAAATSAVAGVGLAVLSAGRGAPWSEPLRALHCLRAGADWPRVYGLLRNLWDAPALRAQVYGPRMLDAALPDAFDDLRARWPAEPDPVLACARYEWSQKMVNDLLWQEDRCSMAVGLEVRVPFVDPMLHAHAQSLSRRERMQGGRLKGHLRDALGARLPRAVLDRPKSGFQVDSPSFFGAALGPAARVLLAPSRVREYGLFNPAFVATLLSLPVARGHRWHYFMLYLMLMTHLWLELFERGRDCADLSAELVVPESMAGQGAAPGARRA